MKALHLSDYKAVRGDIRPGDVVLCRDRSLLSRIIRVIGQGRWSHCALLDRLHGRVIVYESRFPRGRMMPLSDWLKERHGEVYVARSTHASVGEFTCEWALGAHYRPYAWRDLVKYVVWRACDWWPGKRDTAHQLVCSELVGRALQFGGLDVPQPGPMLAPADVAAIVTLRWRIK